MKTHSDAIVRAFEKAVLFAITAMGDASFKQTSFFTIGKINTKIDKKAA